MNIISISTDRKIFEEGSDVQRRQVEYGSACTSLHIVVFTKGTEKALQLSKNVYVHPTNSRSRWQYVRDAIRIGKQLAKPDRVTAQDPFECGVAGFRIAKYFNAALELQIHTDIGSPYFRNESIFNMIRFQIARRLLPRASHVRVVSERISTYIIHNMHVLPERVEVRPVSVPITSLQQAVITTDLHKKYPQFRRIILMASRMTKEKNIDLAIEAMAIVARASADIGLVIVGDGPEKLRLQEKVQRMHLTSAIYFEEWVDHLAPYYKTANVFLVTSLYEGYGRSIVEARSVGTPVISTDVGIAKECGARIVEMRAEALAQALIAP